MTKKTKLTILKSSFRDPSGFVFRAEGQLLRSVHPSYREHYDRFMQSGLRKKLLDEGLIIPFEELSFDAEEYPFAYKILKPDVVPFISYPYEWCFSQWKDAALVLLRIQSVALDFGMSLKDASAYNLQFVEGKPLLIDLLSFETYRENKPWVALRQFCQHFLAPLALMSLNDVRFGQLLRVFIDGIPMDLASKTLPLTSWLTPSLFFYIHAHAIAHRRSPSANSKKSIGEGKFSLNAFKTMVDQLRKSVSRFKWESGGTRWSDYAGNDLVESEYFRSKQDVIIQFVESIKPRVAWDFGANTGIVSRMLASKGVSVVSLDSDFGAIEKNYLELKTSAERQILPLVFDLTNPSPAVGWNNEERESLFERGQPDVILCLALIHHLAIGNNVPLGSVGKFLSALTPWLIIEFVPKADPNVKTMLAMREDIFYEYSEQGFEKAFGGYFEFIRKETLRESDRVLYLMKARRS
jgi:hypothetical protein